MRVTNGVGLNETRPRFVRVKKWNSPCPPPPEPCLSMSVLFVSLLRLPSFPLPFLNHAEFRPRLQTIARPPPGQDFPEDVAGGLHLATGLDWRSSIRLCILIADAPCHGREYHGGIGDNYPGGCPKGKDPTKLLYQLQVRLVAEHGWESRRGWYTAVNVHRVLPDRETNLAFPSAVHAHAAESFLARRITSQAAEQLPRPPFFCFAPVGNDN